MRDETFRELALIKYERFRNLGEASRKFHCYNPLEESGHKKKNGHPGNFIPFETLPPNCQIFLALNLVL